MKIALLMSYNVYHGREYMEAMIKSKVKFDIISISNDAHNHINNIEDLRTDYSWKPEKLKNMTDKVENHFRFESLSDPKFIKHLELSKYQIGIQGGGLGILKKEVIKTFILGLLNFHPGDLPAYRGSSAPEWQVLEGNKVTSTCHLIDTGVDTGNIIGKRKLNLDYSNYYLMRANIYPEIALHLIEVILKIIKNNNIEILEVQNEDFAVYRKYMGDKEIENLKSKMKQGDIFKMNYEK
jgi:methionyl-tRNA formyltransferase